ncbi:hypothetical protein KIN20_031606 [Parelaphostrongylus tenuis]|uniref:Uncharacterized protein n=1 Tax=Parelaphostrongylus tenuis TaxID=148309 RepID=A0AAD5WH39_PARTN|nr:hypothetical protein KIN20_031606 [Parelaphostrongylus tenuis]
MPANYSYRDLKSSSTTTTTTSSIGLAPAKTPMSLAYHPVATLFSLFASGPIWRLIVHIKEVLTKTHQRDYFEISSRSSDVIHSSSEVSSGQMSTSATIGSSYDDEEATDFETDGTSDVSVSSTQPSDTSYQLSALNEELDREKLAKLVQLHPADKEWITAAWDFVDNGPTFCRSPRAVKVVRKAPCTLRRGKNNWTELYRENYLRRRSKRHCSPPMDELKRLSLNSNSSPLSKVIA